jgi:3-hydroxyacyl-[acyl-carrier-protein] dehydratase
MVLDSLFVVQEIKTESNEIKASLRVNAAHEIFKGHFPGQPIVPGVCMMQLAKELVERQLKKKFLLAEADNMKFLSIIDPGVNENIEATVGMTEKDESVLINATLFAGTVTFFKLKAVLKFSN